MIVSTAAEEKITSLTESSCTLKRAHTTPTAVTTYIPDLEDLLTSFVMITRC